MGKWSNILDGDVAASTSPASHVAALRFPKLEGWAPGRVWATWPVEDDFVTPVGPLFGGYLAALADHLMANALFTVLEDHEVFSTTDLHTSFLRAVRGGVVRVEATVVSRGRRTAFCDAEFRNGAGELVARASATQAISEMRTP